MCSDSPRRAPRRGRSAAFARAAVVAVVLLAGCRNLVQPETPPLGPVLVKASVIDPQGLAVDRALVRVRDSHFVPPPDESFSWNGNTDNLGRFELEVPRRGPFDVSVSPPSNSVYPDYVFEEVTFAPGSTTLMYHLQPVMGVLNLPPQFLPSSSSLYALWFRYRPGTVSRELDAILGANGHFQAWLLPGRYQAGVSTFNDHASVHYAWPDSISVDPDSVLTLDVPLVSFQVDLALAGSTGIAAAFSARVYDETTSDNTIEDGALGQGPVTLWGFEGPASLRISPKENAPFLERRFFLDLVQGLELAFDLGRYRLDVRVLDPQDQPWVGANVRVTGELGSRSIDTDTDGRVRFFLEPGRYRVEVGIQDRHADVFVEITQDLDLPIVLE
jgi:hypothetical protein